MNSASMPEQALIENADLNMPANQQSEEILNRIGQLTRVLHDSLGGLGIHKILEQVACDIPDARDRLEYVARMTEQAAMRVLNATDEAMPLQSAIVTQAQVMQDRWQALLAKPSLKSEYNQAVAETRLFLSSTEQNATTAKAILMDIMMAQDFQDLTGQIIKKITALAHDMEKQLLQVLLDFSPTTVKKDLNLMASELPTAATLPQESQVQLVVDGAAADQSQVDDLLASLGF